MKPRVAVVDYGMGNRRSVEKALQHIGASAVITRDRSGEYRIGVSDFFRQPGGTPDQEHNLSAGALIVGVEVRVVPEARRSGYLKVRDRESFEFALASAAVALDITAGSVRGARVAVGGVGTVPWRLQAVERAIIGRTVSPDLWRDAALHAADGAKPLSENAFKVQLVKRTVERQLQRARRHVRDGTAAER